MIPVLKRVLTQQAKPFPERQLERVLSSLNESGFCIFNGVPHNIDSNIENGIIVDGSGKQVLSQGKPFQNGYMLQSTETAITDESELGYVRVFKTMAPIRDALMYRVETLSSSSWQSLTSEL